MWLLHSHPSWCPVQATLQIWLCESVAMLVSPTVTCHTTHLTRTSTYTNTHSHTRLLTQVACTHMLTHTPGPQHGSPALP